MSWIKNNRPFLKVYLFVVIIPLLFILFYLLIFAQERYVTESTLVVKQVGEVEAQTSTGLGALLGVSNTSTEDAQFLKAYIQSRDLVEILDKKINLSQEFKGSGSDPIFELSDNASKEELVEYYRKHVGINYDEPTHLLTLRTEGFSPEFTLLLNQTIISESEKFINNVSQNLAEDQLQFAKQQLVEASESLTKSKEAVLRYQNKNQMYDPQEQAAVVASIVAALESNLAQLQTEERSLLSYLNPTAPQVVAVQSQIDSVKKQIQDEKSKLTSPGHAEKLNRSALDFEELKAKVSFNSDLYKLALASLEKARLEAVRKLKNVVIIAHPQLPQDALYPRVFYIVFSAFLLLNILLGIGMLIRSVRREHKE